MPITLKMQVSQLYWKSTESPLRCATSLTEDLGFEVAHLQLEVLRRSTKADRPEFHAIYRCHGLIVPDTMEGEQSRASGMQPQGPFQAALRLQSGLGAPNKQSLATFELDRGLLRWL